MVDEYGHSEKRTLDVVRARARVVQASIDQGTSDLERLIATYMVINKAENGKKAKEPSFGRGARRKKFATDKERRAYDACFKCQERLERWKKEKARLLTTLMFFAISLLPGDDPVANPSTFIAFARDSHERWGIESGIRDVKERFLAKGRSRQPCMRQFRLILGMMLYNRWEVNRKRVTRVQGDENPDDVLAFFEARSWIRRKHEQECRHLPTAVGFLVRSWRVGILSLVKTLMDLKK
jgi:hypothetical protein